MLSPIMAFRARPTWGLAFGLMLVCSITTRLPAPLSREPNPAPLSSTSATISRPKTSRRSLKFT